MLITNSPSQYLPEVFDRVLDKGIGLRPFPLHTAACEVTEFEGCVVAILDTDDDPQEPPPAEAVAV